MMNASIRPLEFRKIGGSYQFTVKSAGDLACILDLDPALWAALNAPVHSLRTDRRFLDYLDADKSGTISADNLCHAIRQVMLYTSDPACLDDPLSGLPVSALRQDNSAGRDLRDFVEKFAASLTADGRLQPDLTARKLAEVAASPFRGDGILTREAAAAKGAEPLFDAVLSYGGGIPIPGGTARGITMEQLENFRSNAADFITWSNTTVRPEFRGQNPVGLYEIFHGLQTKLEEYFRFCDLVRLDPANLKRFHLNPEALPPLDLRDAKAVATILESAPLSMPDPAGVLELTKDLNPVYETGLLRFKECFALEKLSHADFLQMQQDFAPYSEYLGEARGNAIGAMGREKLQELLNGPASAALDELFARDGLQGKALQYLRTLDMLLLYKTHLLQFVNNFVSFRDLFAADSRSILQAGKLVMDGRSYYLTVIIPNVAEHKKIAAASNLCMLYLELHAPDKPTFFVAVAVTGGDLSRIYIGKPVYFIDHEDHYYRGKVVDIVEGPISFLQTVLSPFRRLYRVIGERIQKMMDFNAVEKQLESTISTGKKPAQPPPGNSSWMGKGSIFLLAGGISVAALGAAFSFLLKSIRETLQFLCSLSAWTLLGWIAGLLCFILIPISCMAVLKMRQRNLTLFLEAAGWAVNLPMRLNASVSSLFTRSGVYPPNTRFNRTEWVQEKIVRFKPGRFFLCLALGLALLALGSLVYYFAR